MDIAYLMTEIEKVRLSILNGRVFHGLNNLLKLRRGGYDVDITLIEDILRLPSLLEYLYDETSIGNATTAIRCLAALKELNLDIDKEKINYIRYKKLSMLGMDIQSYFSKARPALQQLLEILESFFVHVGDYRECILHKTESKITFEEDIFVRFPNAAFRELFLQLAFQEAIATGLSFHWENHHSVYNRELTGKISWSLIQNSGPLANEWYRTVKSKFDRFILALRDKLFDLDLPRYSPQPRNRGELLWIVFSRDNAVSQRLAAALRNYKVIQLNNIKLLQRYMEQENGNLGSFILHAAFNDYKLLQSIVDMKLRRPTCGAPFFVFADNKYFQVMRDHSLLFPGCEFICPMTPENVSNLEYIVSRVLENRRRFIRLPMGLECKAEFVDDIEHTRATPVSVGGAYIKTHRIVPVFSGARITLLDRSYDFEVSTTGKVVYNGKGGSAIRFDNIVSFEKYKELRQMALDKHSRILDTLQRSRL